MKTVSIIGAVPFLFSAFCPLPVAGMKAGEMKTGIWYRTADWVFVFTDVEKMCAARSYGVHCPRCDLKDENQLHQRSKWDRFKKRDNQSPYYGNYVQVDLGYKHKCGTHTYIKADEEVREEVN